MGLPSLVLWELSLCWCSGAGFGVGVSFGRSELYPPRVIFRQAGEEVFRQAVAETAHFVGFQGVRDVAKRFDNAKHRLDRDIAALFRIIELLLEVCVKP